MSSVDRLIEPLRHSPQLPQAIAILQAELEAEFPRNDYEPDVVFFGPDKSSSLSPDTMKFPVPDMAVEVLSQSTKVRDRGVKFEDFASNCVAEYWIVDADTRIVEQYLLENGEYTLALKSGSGMLKFRQSKD